MKISNILTMSVSKLNTVRPRFERSAKGLGKLVRQIEGSLYRGSFFIYFAVT